MVFYRKTCQKITYRHSNCKILFRKTHRNRVSRTRENRRQTYIFTGQTENLRFLKSVKNEVKVILLLINFVLFLTELHNSLAKQHDEATLRRMKESWEKKLPNLNDYLVQILPLLRNASKENSELFKLYFLKQS